MKRRELRVVRGEERFALSIGVLVEALQTAGVPTDDAIAMVAEVEGRLRARSDPQVELAELTDMLADLVRERQGEETARRLAQQTPPFVPLTVLPSESTSAAGVGSDRAKRFSRRTLVSSLEKLGLGFKEANAVAASVEQGIRAGGIEHIEQDDLARRVAMALEARYGRDLRLRYEAQTFRAFELSVVSDRSSLPFSRGILAQSLLAIGLGPDLSHNLARRAEEALYALDVTEVSSDVVRESVSGLLRQEAGEEFAQRYALMREARHSEKPIFILIGGAPGVGKSAVAAEVGYRLGIPRVVSTDSVRQALRSLIGPELSPVLHASTFSAWRAELLPFERSSARPRRNRVLRGYLAQVHQLGPAITGIIERNTTEATSLVMEGSHLVPGVAPRKEFPDATVIPLMLYLSDQLDHRKHFDIREGKAHSRQADTYLEHFEEIRTMQDFLRERAELEGVPVIEASDFERAIERCIDRVLDMLLLEHLRRESAVLQQAAR